MFREVFRYYSQSKSCGRVTIARPAIASAHPKLVSKT